MFNPNPSPITAEQITDLPVPSSVKLSPTGTHAVYTLKPYGQKGEHTLSSLWLATVGTPDSARQLTSGLFHDRHPQWSPDGSSIAFVSDREKSGEMCAVYVLQLAGGEAVPMSPKGCKRGIEMVRWSPDGAFVAYLSADEKGEEAERREREREDVNVYGVGLEYNRLRVVHVATGTVEVLYARDRHVVSFAWSMDSKRIGYVVQDGLLWDTALEDGVDIEIVTLASKEVKRLYHHPAPIMMPIAWGPDGIYFISGLLPNAASAWVLWMVDVGAGTAEVKAYGDEDDADGVVATKDFVCTLVMAGLSGELRMLGGATIYSAKKEVGSWDVVAKEDGNGYVGVVTRSSAAKPSEVYSFSYSSSSSSLSVEKPVQLSSHGSHIASANLGVSHEISCRSYDDKVLLEGFYVTPTDKAHEKPLPTAVIIHGGPYFRQTDSFLAPHHPWMPAILAAGKYGVLLPNYRGNAGQGEAFAAHVLGNCGTLEYDDVLALVDEGIKRGCVDPKNVIVGGWSYGGLLSYLSCVRNGFTLAGEPKDWKYKGAIPGAGVSDWDTMAFTTDVPQFQHGMTGAAPWTVSDKTETEGRRGSALWELKKGRDRVPPVLLLHGEMDVRVPVSQAWAFQRGCKNLKIPCEMVTYPREGHMIEERGHMVDMLKRVRKFCDMHLDG